MTKIIVLAERTAIDGRVRVAGEIVSVPDDFAPYLARRVIKTFNPETRGEQQQREIGNNPPRRIIPPTAVINSPTAGRVSSVLEFNASDSKAGDGRIALCSWDFGDGETGEGITVSHAFTARGQYTITLTVIDEFRATAEATQDVGIS